MRSVDILVFSFHLANPSCCRFPGWDEFRLVSVHIILEGISHNGSKSTRGKTISRMCTDPLKKRLPEYLKLSKPKLLALPEKPLRLKGR